LFGRIGLFNYLDFADYDRTFSYAASFGIDAIPPQHLDAVRNGLNHIKYISVREEAGKRIVQELTGRTDVQVLVDPTMLLTADEWDIIAEKPRGDIPERYILTYFLGNVSDARRAVIVQKAHILKAMICTELIEFRRCAPPVIMIAFQDNFLTRNCIDPGKISGRFLQRKGPTQIAQKNRGIRIRYNRHSVLQFIHITGPVAAEDIHGFRRTQAQVQISNCI
jgi:hypothetical protein